MKKLMILLLAVSPLLVLAQCPKLTDSQLKAAATQSGFSVDSDYGQPVYALNDAKCLYQMRAHKSSIGYIVTLNPSTGNLVSEQRGGYQQNFDSEFNYYYPNKN